MALYTPGTLIHYRASGSGMPIWPAVVCTDDVAPKEFLRTRPVDYVTLVLRLAEPLQFHWARATEMHEYNPFVPFEDEDTVDSTPGLGDAYAIADSALEAGLGLDHWRAQVRNMATVISSDSEDAEDNDPDLRRAIRESRRSFYGKKPARLPLSPKPSRRGSIIDKSHIEELDEIGLRRQTPATEGLYTLPERPQSLRRRDRLRTPPSLLSDSERPFENKTKSIPTASHGDTRPSNSSTFSLSSASNNLLSWDKLGKSGEVSDVVEGDLAASKEYVLIQVGPEDDERMIHKSCVWDRPYFRDMRTGVMHFGLSEEGLWVLTHPGFAEIAPEDFVYIAEYLESGEFGHKRPEGEEQVQEAFAQIISAWATANILGMTDLLDHILDKLERLAPWDMWNIMTFACLAYESPEPSLPAQERLKDILATDIAQNYWIYIEDDHLSASFIHRLKELPELERDIYVRRTMALNARLQSEEDGEEQENNDMDMD